MNGIRWKISLLLAALLLFAGCAREAAKAPAALTELPASQADAAWDLPNRLISQGEGNVYRFVAGEGLLAPAALELAASGQGQLEYRLEAPARKAWQAKWRLEFLSTQGVGRIQVSGLAADGSPLAAVGWVYTGSVPANTASEIWQDARYKANYAGDWQTAAIRPAELLAAHFPPAVIERVERYRVSMAVGQGQHAFITELSGSAHPEAAVGLQSQSVQPVAKGQEFVIQARAVNADRQPVEGVTASLLVPLGYGVRCLDGTDRVIGRLEPGESAELTWRLLAQRDDAVNLGQPWQVGFSLNGVPTAENVSVHIADSTPGTIYYVMTEDLEPMDSAGYPTPWGNGDGWLEPDEFTGQMIHKSEKLNEIADRYGAKWTHYIAWSAVEAATWASDRSSSGAWPAFVAAMKESVRRQSAAGHEYAVHLHMDYDPILPGNNLSYNEKTDGIWANHLRHGWAHEVLEEGGLSDPASRTGVLFRSQRALDELTAASGQGQALTARAGSFDFGATPEDQAKSVRAYRAVGLWASSDADGNVGGITSGEYGKEIYWTRPDSINQPAKSLDAQGVIEIRPTPRNFINYDSQSADVMNGLADEGMKLFAPAGSVHPGVHAIVGFTHAMFVLGAGDWQSTEGGHFLQIEKHLAYLKQRYADAGLLQFATASELTKAYIDYYTPEPVAVYGGRLEAGSWRSEFAISLLGRDIPIDNDNPHRLRVKYPLYLREDAFLIRVLKNGVPIYSAWGLPTPENDVEFVADDRQAEYVLQVYHNPYAAQLFGKLRALKAKFFSVKT